MASFVETMNLSMCTVRKQKVCKERIFSTAFLPSCNRLLAVAGDKWGRIGFWDVVRWWFTVICRIKLVSCIVLTGGLLSDCFLTVATWGYGAGFAGGM